MSNYPDFVSVDPEIRFGKPCIRGTRITLNELLDWINAGMSDEEILDDHRSLTREQIQAARRYSLR
ncbi:MAG: DUF433 domain-containing protein [Flavobacteriales bacterium]|nr:DUF433 domain-containing protein [Flavobacteriales bacterium]